MTDIMRLAAFARATTTAAQRRAVAAAIAHMRAMFSELIPPFDLRWIDPAHPEPGFPVDTARALTGFSPDGAILICVRTDQTPTQLFDDTLHEIAHVIDRASVNSPAFDRAACERTAEAVAHAARRAAR